MRILRNGLAISLRSALLCPQTATPSRTISSMPPKRMRFALAILSLALAAACGRPTGVPASSSSDQQKLPFDREPSSKGLSPSQSLIPPTRRLAEGTTIAVSLQKPLSNASAHAGDAFDGTLDEPVVVEGQTLIERGNAVTGRVLDAQPPSGRRPGYLRVTLVSVDVDGKKAMIETSSIFAKGKAGPLDRRPGGPGDVVFGPDRRLTFHLAEAADLP